MHWAEQWIPLTTIFVFEKTDQEVIKIKQDFH